MDKDGGGWAARRACPRRLPKTSMISTSPQAGQPSVSRLVPSIQNAGQKPETTGTCIRASTTPNVKLKRFSVESLAETMAPLPESRALSTRAPFSIRAVLASGPMYVCISWFSGGAFSKCHLVLSIAGPSNSSLQIKRPRGRAPARACGCGCSGSGHGPGSGCGGGGAGGCWIGCCCPSCCCCCCCCCCCSCSCASSRSRRCSHSPTPAENAPRITAPEPDAERAQFPPGGQDTHAHIGFVPLGGELAEKIVAFDLQTSMRVR